MRNHHVDHVAAKQRLEMRLAQRFREGAVLLLRGGLQEQFRVFGHVVANPGQIGGDLGGIVESRARLVDPARHRASGHLGIQGLDPHPVLAFQLRRIAQHIGQFALEPRDLLLDHGLLVFGKLVELLGLDDLAIPHRRNHEAHRRPDQSDILGARAAAEIGHRTFLQLAELLVDGAALGLVFL